MQSIDLNAWFGAKKALKNINICIKTNAVTAIIGPSGCGKSTFIRCLNRMHELTPTAKMTGQILLDGQNIYDKQVDPVQVRRRAQSPGRSSMPSLTGVQRSAITGLSETTPWASATLPIRPSSVKV